ncbi:hypothetical protein [Paenibacillus methanolicus]|uniref:Uncharacterized protein n=1 Tax=Paenibacillus methanolicus TaxID=582686 RepID=A0A5S5C8B0_9BACL|nr:hypothetical protein [Paenibacillus methanolicus]TYP74570.1 hypothetical protein BCM02_105114 [Paenibacillus methanolicus]
MKTKLMKNEVVVYGNDDPKAEFWREFYSEKEFNLPPGTYHIKAMSLFSLDESVVDSPL